MLLKDDFSLDCRDRAIAWKDDKIRSELSKKAAYVGIAGEEHVVYPENR